MINLPESYKIDDYGFIHQTQHDKFDYTVEYREHQSTNIEMSYLRLGFIASHFGYRAMQSMQAVDVGCGSGIFVKCCQGKFKKIVGYDVVGDSISTQELYDTNWDIVILTDVLEHFENMYDLFRIKWSYAMISYPETPCFTDFEDMKKWRHFKPNEHLHYLNATGMRRWLEEECGLHIIMESDFEDLIRSRWDIKLPNITTMLVNRE